MDWTYSGSGIDVDPMFGSTHEKVFAYLGACGTWWTGEQRVEMVEQTRAAAECALCKARREALSPNSVEGEHEAIGNLPAAAVEAVHRIATDPGRLTRAWADEVMGEIGAGPYVEIAALVSTQFAIDGFATAIGVEVAPLPNAGRGEPSRLTPDGVGDVGAWVAQTVDKTLANVTRAASLVPAENDNWRIVATWHYSRGPEFMSLEWDRALSRPQVETVAAVVSSLNECFY
ncbi:MAG: hypothetical protein ACI8Y4_002196 [Candidatus Poriferisodalaceae bacterium]|jgi:hypothetical protein